MFNNCFFFKLVPFMIYVEKYCRAGQATDENMAHVHGMLVTKGNKYTQYVIHSAFSLQQGLYECSSLLHYMCIACLVTLS